MNELRMKSENTKSTVPIVGYDNVYSVDTDGNIYRNGYKMSPANNGLGYFQIKLRNNGKRFNRYVHRIIWEAFRGPVPEGMEINHIDHNKSNNALSNLELVTHKENLKKAVEMFGPSYFRQ